MFRNARLGGGPEEVATPLLLNLAGLFLGAWKVNEPEGIGSLGDLIGGDVGDKGVSSFCCCCCFCCCC